ncbi:MAG: hypothetical protein JRI23_35725 [Deltaproteobacteria bacterium]|jgi:hypothetical protein|nr:hypothetical protein [Deltaproteobacteria bacterium]MBW2537682.1 hypothetical protein [Deltaproteobacteria bacterium]
MSERVVSAFSRIVAACIAACIAAVLPAGCGQRDTQPPGVGTAQQALPWIEEAKLTASDGANGHQFGHATGLDADTAVLGAPGATGSHNAAYAFVRAASGWTEQQRLTAAQSQPGDYFGGAVGVSGDTAIVGAAAADSASGTAYVFLRNALAWSEQQKLTAGDAQADQGFGCAVALDGDTVLVGANGDGAGGVDAGAAYVFIRTGVVWLQQAKLTAPDGAAGDLFGQAVALDVDTAVIGAHSSDGASADVGSAYVFARSAGLWSAQSTLAATDADSDDQLGWAVAVRDDTAVVGALLDDEGGADAGAAYVFGRSASAWTQQQKLTAQAGGAGHRFGSAVGIQGAAIAVGASGYATDAGAVYAFARSAATWAEEERITAIDAASTQALGFSLALRRNLIVAGAPYHAGAGVDAGAAYAIALRFGNGAPCVEPADCWSGFCADSVCCDSACSGTDSACITCRQDEGATADGVCTLLDGTPCGDGLCEECSSGSCVLTEAGTPGPGCTGSGSDCDGEDLCDGTGQCDRNIAPDGKHCLLTEDGVPRGECRDGDCDLFDPTAPFLTDDGLPCVEGVECKSTFCVEGICCQVPSCHPFRCGGLGTCLARCESTADCRPDFTCWPDGTCVYGDSIDQSTDVGCGCALVGSRSPPPAGGQLALLFAGLSLGVRRRAGGRGGVDASRRRSLR